MGANERDLVERQLSPFPLLCAACVARFLACLGGTGDRYWGPSWFIVFVALLIIADVRGVFYVRNKTVRSFIYLVVCIALTAWVTPMLVRLVIWSLTPQVGRC